MTKKGVLGSSLRMTKKGALGSSLRMTKKGALGSSCPTVQAGAQYAIFVIRHPERDYCCFSYKIYSASSFVLPLSYTFMLLVTLREYD
jgi:hypothetical protein